MLRSPLLAYRVCGCIGLVSRSSAEVRCDDCPIAVVVATSRDSSILQLSTSGANDPVQPNGPGDTLQFNVSDELERNPVGVCRSLTRLLADEHFARTGVIRNPRRDVHSPSEVVAFLDDDRAGVDADAR